MDDIDGIDRAGVRIRALFRYDSSEFSALYLEFASVLQPGLSSLADATSVYTGNPLTSNYSGLSSRGDINVFGYADLAVGPGLDPDFGALRSPAHRRAPMTRSSARRATPRSERTRRPYAGSRGGRAAPWLIHRSCRLEARAVLACLPVAWPPDP